jgi:hypothetical protein
MRDDEDGTDAATLVITTDAGSKIPLGFEGVTSYFARHIANLKHLHAFLSYQSFSYRVERYLEEVKAQGFFTYDNCRFYPRRSIVCGSKEIPVGAAKLRKGNGFIELRKKDRTFLDDVKHRLHLSRWPRISTENDGDVIFHLLDKLFGQRWKR